ncbi:MAG: tetratricopeptide repeat protein, partial [Candidatus Poribacteria bacterium]|nr:tetratricopeptide repeat protein [Candidatus Poribacteria bacterium]
MQTQLIQKKAQIGSQVEFTLTTGNQISGLLKEMSLEHVTLDSAKGEMTILVESIIAVQSLDNTNASESPPNIPDLDSQVNTSESSNSKLNKIEVPGSANTDLSEVQVPDRADANTESTDPVPEEVEVPNDKDADAESIVSLPKEMETSDDTDANLESIASVDFEKQVSEKLDEIEKRFNNQIEGAKPGLKPPDLNFPAKELPGWQTTDIAGKWLQIKNKYENAQRINELGTKFGRIQPLLIELTPLVRRFPNSLTLKRTVAYFNALSHPDEWQKTIDNYQDVAFTSDHSNDWFNVAASALNQDKEELACYSLEKFFYKVPVVDEPNAWNIYVNLVEKFNNLPAFRELCKKSENDIAEEEIEALLDAAIYLFKRKVTTELATEIVQKRMKGEPGSSLLKEVCQKLGGQSTESYRQFLTEFMNAMIASEKGTSPSIPEYPERSGTVEKSVDYMSSQKRDIQTQAKDPYTSAKHADLVEKDLVKAERLFRKCVSQNIRHDSAIKDLAMVLVRLGRPGEAVELLETKRPDIEDKQSLDNTLIMVYPAAGQYEKAIDLLSKTLNQTSEKGKKVYLYFQMASNYIKLGNYASAEDQFRQVLKLNPYNITAQRSLALCLSKQDRYIEAEKFLKQIQRNSPDRKTAALLEAVERAQRTGEFILDDESIIEIETALSHFSSELSEFAQFFLQRCEFDGVLPARVNEGKYIGSEKDFQHDIARLEDVAKQLGTKRPRDRGHYYLSAARIYFDLGVNQNFFYRYLCRSFASRGDAALSENKHLDTVRVWYCEALTAYDGDKTRRR